MASRSLSRCSGLLMPISRWISVSDSADMMAPLFTLARQAATYQAGIPTHSWRRDALGPQGQAGQGARSRRERAPPRIKGKPYLQPNHHGRSIPLCERQTLSPGFLEQFVPANDKRSGMKDSACTHPLRRGRLCKYPRATFRRNGRLPASGPGVQGRTVKGIPE